MPSRPWSAGPQWLELFRHAPILTLLDAVAMDATQALVISTEPRLRAEALPLSETGVAAADGCDFQVHGLDALSLAALCAVRTGSPVAVEVEPSWLRGVAVDWEFAGGSVPCDEVWIDAFASAELTLTRDAALNWHLGL